MIRHPSLRTFAVIVLFAVVAACKLQPQREPAAAVDAEAEKQAILGVIGRMEAAWNRGDFRGYMQGFANPDVIFVSRGEFQKDWQGTLDHYIRDYGTSPETRGHGTHTWARFWRQELIDLLARTEGSDASN